jgi:DNA-binding NarL/FixJ family response regulator
MPVLNGMDAAIEIQQTCPRTKAILLTMYPEDQYVLQALGAGIRGYVIKTQAAEDLVHAVRQVSCGMLYLSPGITQTIVDAFLAKSGVPRNPLTARERQVLQLIAEGRTTKEIASFMTITTKTAESHRSHIMEKLGIHETAGLVRYAIRQGLIQP